MHGSRHPRQQGPLVSSLLPRDVAGILNVGARPSCNVATAATHLQRVVQPHFGFPGLPSHQTEPVRSQAQSDAQQTAAEGEGKPGHAQQRLSCCRRMPITASHLQGVVQPFFGFPGLPSQQTEPDGSQAVATPERKSGHAFQRLRLILRGEHGEGTT